MQGSGEAFVLEAVVILAAGTDPGAVGAAVTTELCGHWEHEGACRWPHNNEIVKLDDGCSFRTLFVAPAAEEAEVRGRIEAALRRAQGWEVERVAKRGVRPNEAALATRLAAPG